jgi:hypothetical protein
MADVRGNGTGEKEWMNRDTDTAAVPACALCSVSITTVLKKRVLVFHRVMKLDLTHRHFPIKCPMPSERAIDSIHARKKLKTKRA